MHHDRALANRTLAYKEDGNTSSSEENHQLDRSERFSLSLSSEYLKTNEEFQGKYGVLTSCISSGTHAVYVIGKFWVLRGKQLESGRHPYQEKRVAGSVESWLISQSHHGSGQHYRREACKLKCSRETSVLSDELRSTRALLSFECLIPK